MSDSMDRRRFLGALPAATAVFGSLGALRRGDGRYGPLGDNAASGAPGLASAPGLFGEPAHRASMTVAGVQLYTLRSVMNDGPDATLATLAEIGYKEVELAGLYGRTPREMRRALDAAGLTAASSHHGVGEVREGWERTLEGAQELGQSLIVVPSIPGSERSSEALARVADDFNRGAEVARAAGIRFGYHNHDWEFEPLPDGTLPMDLLLERCDPDLVDWQMDIFWTVHGGADPLAYLDAQAGRVTSVHIKDRLADGSMVSVGDGVIDFRAILGRANSRGLLHGFVEHDQPDDAVESVRRSYRTLAGLGLAGPGD